jgi:hypothetical protein
LVIAGSAAVRAGQVEDVPGVELGDGDHQGLAVLLRYASTLFRAVDDHTFLGGQQVRTIGPGPAPRLVQDAPAEPYVVGHDAALPGAGVVRAGRPGFVGRPEQRAADRTVSGGGRTDAGAQSHGGPGAVE